MSLLAGRRVLITGAASGIGRATARLFRDEGAALALIDRDARALASAARSLGGDEIAALAVDVTDEAAVETAVVAAADRLGGLDGVVNGAGIALTAPLETITRPQWDEVLAVNLTGPMLVCRAALGALTDAGGGTIVNIASGAALRPLDNQSAYCAAKAGLVMLSKALALELAPRGIRVNALCPGVVDTPLFRSAWELAPDAPLPEATIRARYALGRIADPKEIATAALFLTGPHASYVTGTAMAVDGGRTFH